MEFILVDGDPLSVVEVALAIIILVGVIFLAFRLAHSGSSDAPSQPSSTSQPPPRSRPISPRKKPAEITRVQPSRFDAESAKHLKEKRILTGAAYITDGDTIKINKTQVRLFGVDAPELNHPFGKKAKWALHKLCKGHVVRAEIIDEDVSYSPIVGQYLA